LLHAVAHRLACLPIPHLEGALFRSYTQVADILLGIQHQCWREVDIAMADARVPVLVLKGLFLTSHVYPPTAVYIGADIDLLVRPVCISKVKGVMMRCGYSQRLSLLDGVPRLLSDELIDQMEAGHYELAPFTRVVEAPQLTPLAEFIKEHRPGFPFLFEDGRPYVAVVVDLHHNLSHGIDEMEAWRSPVPFHVSGRRAMAPSPETLVWFLAARLYHEVMVHSVRKIKLAADLTALLGRVTVDWQTVLQVADRYHLEPGLHYVLSFLSVCCGVAVPGEVLRALAMTAHREPSCHDWGDFIPKLVRRQPTFVPRCASTGETLLAGARHQPSLDGVGAVRGDDGAGAEVREYGQDPTMVVRCRGEVELQEDVPYMRLDGLCTETEAVADRLI